MNGPEHYHSAESLLKIAEGAPPNELREAAFACALAQAHATLALAAATALPAAKNSSTEELWLEATKSTRTDP